jgi:cytochrome c5
MDTRTSATRWYGLARGARWVALSLVLSAMSMVASAQHRDRSGEEVVGAVCIACHGSGANGAPKIGDEKAWAARASQGLTVLTSHALTGIRNMPAHGGNPGVTDVEIGRAITYMVNKSGGHWIEPINGATAVPRSGQQVVQMQCSQCHATGVSGAPKIGDRAAWIPRLAKGLGALEASAIHGHGAMPARGGLADLSDDELRGAILYMFNYGVPAPQSSPPPVSTGDDPYHKVIAGIDLHLGMMPAEVIRAAQAEGKPLSGMSGRVPSGKGYYYLTISIADAKTNASISDATIKVKVADALAEEIKTLRVMAANNAITYGNYFRISSGSAYTITASIRRPLTNAATVASFDFKEP